MIERTGFLPSEAIDLVSLITSWSSELTDGHARKAIIPS